MMFICYSLFFKFCWGFFQFREHSHYFLYLNTTKRDSWLCWWHIALIIYSTGKTQCISKRKKTSLLDAHWIKSKCNQRVNIEKSFLVLQEYRLCKAKGETQQIIRKDKEGIEKVASYILAIAEKKVRLLTCSIGTEVFSSNQYKIISANISQVKILWYAMKLHKNYFLVIEFPYESPFMN